MTSTPSVSIATPSILYWLHVILIIYCVGFNVETVEYKGISFTTWDVSGRSGIVSMCTCCKVLTKESYDKQVIPTIKLLATR